MDEEYLTRLIYEYNPQMSGRPFEVVEYKRHLFPVLEKWLDKRQIEFIFKDRQANTEISIKWFYPSSEEWESIVGKKEHELVGFFQATEKKEKIKAPIGNLLGNLARALSVFAFMTHSESERERACQSRFMRWNTYILPCDILQCSIL